MENCFRMRLVLVLLTLAAMSSAMASDLPDRKWLKDHDDLTFVMIGREIGGVYANGVAFTETYRRSGVVEYRDAKNTFNGKWTLKDGGVCTTYEHGDAGCFRIMKLGENCFEYWMVSGQANVVSPSWIARGWQANYPPTCPP
jgi:hypothetical protein